MTTAFITSYQQSRMGPRVRPLTIHKTRTRRTQLVVLALLAVVTGTGAYLDQAGASAAAQPAPRQVQPFSYFPN